MVVYLKRLPSPSVVHALEDGHGVRLGVTEVKRDVGQLVLLLERDGEADVLSGVDDVRLPARHVVGVVQVGEEVGRMGVLGLAAVAQVALATVRLAAEPKKSSENLKTTLYKMIPATKLEKVQSG